MKGVPGWDPSAADLSSPANARVIEIARTLRELKADPQ
jgi:hypothetical protein